MAVLAECCCSTYFYPRPPRGGRLALARLFVHGMDFYPRPPRGGRRAGISKPPMLQTISIHALREEGDADGCSAECAVLVFLSTPSARRATGHQLRKHPPGRFLSTPSARRATSIALPQWFWIAQFLSTPSARRATVASCGICGMLKLFLSTPSARRATGG